VAFLTGSATQNLNLGERRDLAVAVALAMGVSLVGHLLVQRARMRNGAQVERGRALRRETIRQRAEIERLYTELLHTARFDPLTREPWNPAASRASRNG